MSESFRTRLIPLAAMPVTYQRQAKRAISELEREVRKLLAEGVDWETYPPTESGLIALLADLSFEVADRRLGAYDADSSDLRVERILDWRSHVENAAAAGLIDEWMRG